MLNDIKFEDVSHFYVDKLVILEEEPTFNPYTYDRHDTFADAYGVFAFLKAGGDEDVAEFHSNHKGRAEQLCRLLNEALK
jgi:hypothetical protein